jgi:DNA-binding transcriptional LysR family regulator
MRINLNQLRCFYLAVKIGSVSKAAEVLFVTPSAVTMQIKKLEQWLDVRLLIRSGNAIHMTRDAEPIYEQAGKIFREVDVLEVMTANLMRSHKGEVVIGAHHIPAKYILPKLMAQIKRLCPELNVKMVLGPVSELLDRLQKNELHFVLTSSLPHNSRLKTIPILPEDLALVTLRNSKHIAKMKISSREIASIPLLLQERGIAFATDYLDAAGIIPKVVMEDLSADVIKRLIMQDMGGAFLMRFVVQGELDRGLFQEVEVTDGLPVALFSLAYIDEKSFPPDIRALVSLLRKTSFRRGDLV